MLNPSLSDIAPAGDADRQMRARRSGLVDIPDVAVTATTARCKDLLA